jgi:sugar phosphate isomerase/epimerase
MQAGGIAVALSARWYSFPERFRWIAENGFDLEYTPDADNLDRLAGQVDPFLRGGLAVRYHGFFPGRELGHADAALAEDALRIHKRALDALLGHGQPVITVHVGLDPRTEILERRAVDNLARLVEYGGKRGITVCLENLRRGPTSHPETLSAWSSKSGALITFDVGHALSCGSVTGGACTAVEFLELVAGRIHEAHIYGRESDRHYPFLRPEDFRPLGDRLRQTPCRWWTIELEDYAEALETRQIVRQCLEGR